MRKLILFVASIAALVAAVVLRINNGDAGLFAIVAPFAFVAAIAIGSEYIKNLKKMLTR